MAWRMWAAAAWRWTVFVADDAPGFEAAFRCMAQYVRCALTCRLRVSLGWVYGPRGAMGLKRLEEAEEEALPRRRADLRGAVLFRFCVRWRRAMLGYDTTHFLFSDEG